MSLGSIVKNLAAGIVMLGALAFSTDKIANERSILSGNESSHRRIEEYFEKSPNKLVYANGSFFFFRQKERTVESFHKLAASLDTPEKVNDYLQGSQQYRSDKFDGHPGSDYMESPLEFYLSGKGDCEDFANFANYTLSMHGYDTSMIGWLEVDIKDLKQAGHVVCVIHNSASLDFIDNGGYYKGFNSIDALVQHSVSQFSQNLWLSHYKAVPDDSAHNGECISDFAVNQAWFEVNIMKSILDRLLKLGVK